MNKATDRQVNGDHYTQGTIQPIEYIHANDMDFMTGNIIKYATRWPHKGQALSDLRKVIHYAELLIEAEGLDIGCKDDTPTEQNSLPQWSFLKNKWEDEPTAEQMCGRCDCEAGRCLESEWENQEAYEQWQEETMNHPDISAGFDKLKYETR